MSLKNLLKDLNLIPHAMIHHPGILLLSSFKLNGIKIDLINIFKKN
jgi:hypothetical protein